MTIRTWQLATGTGQQGRDNLDRTSEAGRPEKDGGDRIASTGQPGQVSLYSLARKVGLHRYV